MTASAHRTWAVVALIAGVAACGDDRALAPAPSSRRAPRPRIPDSVLLAPLDQPPARYLASPESLTGEVRRRILTMAPETKVESPAPLTLELDRPGRPRRHFKLQELWEKVRGNPDDVEAVVDRFASDSLALLEPPPPPLTAAVIDAHVLPVVRGQDGSFEMLDVLAGVRSPVKEPFAGTHAVAYDLVDAPHHRGLLDRDAIASAGLTIAEVDRRAKRNLRRILATRLVLGSETAGVHVIREGALVNGVLVLDDFWKQMETRFGTPLLVMRPLQDSALYFAKDTPGALDALRTAIEPPSREPPPTDKAVRLRPVVPLRYMRRADGKWEELKTPPSADAQDAGPP